jgi:hypothetical protein
MQSLLLLLLLFCRTRLRACAFLQPFGRHAVGEPRGSARCCAKLFNCDHLCVLSGCGLVGSTLSALPFGCAFFTLFFAESDRIPALLFGCPMFALLFSKTELLIGREEERTVSAAFSFWRRIRGGCRIQRTSAARATAAPRKNTCQNISRNRADNTRDPTRAKQTCG